VCKTKTKQLNKLKISKIYNNSAKKLNILWSEMKYQSKCQLWTEMLYKSIIQAIISFYFIILNVIVCDLWIKLLQKKKLNIKCLWYKLLYFFRFFGYSNIRTIDENLCITKIFKWLKKNQNCQVIILFNS